MENRILAGNTVPSLCSRPLPLSETTVPEMLKVSPATGLSMIESITRKVCDLTIIVEILDLVDVKSELH